MANTGDDEPNSLDGDDFLAANRAKREQIRAQEAGKGEKSEKAEPVESVDERGGVGALVISLAAATVALAVAVAVFAYLAFAGGDDEDLDRAGALRDAKAYAASMLTYEYGNYADLDRRIAEFSTPEFAERYAQSSEQARAGNDEAQASSTGVAETAGIVSITEDEAVVLVALDNTVTSPQAPTLGEAVSQSRVQLTLVRDGDRWLLSDFDVV